MSLSGVMGLQAIILLLYGVPYALVPATMTAWTGQPALPEPAVLRVLGLAFVALAVVELRALAAAVHRVLVVGFALLPCSIFVLIVVQALATGFNGAAWFWWLNGLVTFVVGAGLAIAARQRETAAAVSSA
jgi:hypothetical protein